MDFRAQPMSIGDCLQLNRKYIIPRFQREYSWESDELQAIWEDLLDSITYDQISLKPQEYFLGSLVLVGDDDSQNLERYIVDGQQRLMTFTIAFSVLAQLFEKNGDEKLSHATFAHVLSIDRDGNEYTKLIAETPKPFFQYRVQQKTPDTTRAPQTKEEERILSATRFFEQKLEKNALTNELERRFPDISGKVSYIDLLKAMRDQILICKVVHVTVKQLEDAYAIFEVLNAKGKDLSAVDIIKNSLFSVLSTEEPLDFASEKWKTIRDNLAPTGEEMPRFYRHYWLSKYSFTTEKRLVRDFQREIQKSEPSYTQFIDDLVKESAVYSKIAGPTESDWTQPEDLIVYEVLHALEIFNISQVRTFLLALMDVRKRQLVSHKNFIKALRALERYHFIFTAVCSSRASGLERRYSSYARKLRSCVDKKQTADCIQDLVVALEGTLPGFDSFNQNFQKIAYSTNKSLRKQLVQYILKKIERYYGSNELKPHSFTIEHIIPESTQTPFIGMVGNLLPLGEPLNSAIGNAPFSEKIIHYEKSQYRTAQKFVEANRGKANFTEQDIKNRTTELSELCYAKIWDL